jgi:BirA family biotin operon repressor/biotin-[acetyl-CoA-carboxylase] ligase
VIDYDVRRHDSIGSTNDEALRLAREGAAHGTVVCAREQLAGRGRQGRQWHSPVGNLYVSILLRPDVAPGQAATLSFVTALAVADTVDAFLPGGMHAVLKWPNDVLVQGAKIAGILLEYADAAVVVGIGLNIEHTPTGTPYAVTSVRQVIGLTNTPTATTLLQPLLDAFARRYCTWQHHGFAATRTAWLARAHPAGTPLRVTLGNGQIDGRFSDLAKDGALIIETPMGQRHIIAGEVVPRPA